MIWLSGVFFVLCMVAVGRGNSLDVECGNRDGDYGSNIGWHWPWTPIIQVSFFGCIVCFIYGLAP